MTTSRSRCDCLVVLGVAATLAAPAAAAPGRDVITIRIDPRRTRHVMASGLGASWHALSLEIPLEASVEGSGGELLHVYQVREATLGPEFRMEPVGTLSSSGPAAFDLPARSVTALTAFRLTHEQEGVTTE